MIRFRTLLCAASAACGLTLGFGVQATQITLSLPAGTSCSFANNTLNCAGAGAGIASCSISGQTSPVIGDTATLTGSCVDASGANDPALSWTGCIPVQGTNTCTLISTQPVTLKGAAGGSTTITVTFGAATCSISPLNPVVITGTSQTFSASCNFTPTTYSWTGCSSILSSCTLTAGTSGGQVGVTASNGSSSATAPPTSYTVSTGAANGIPLKCDDTLSSVAAKPVTQLTGLPTGVSISNTQTAVFPIVIPAGVTKFTVPIVQTGNNSDRVPKNVWISKRACFTPPASAGAVNPPSGTALAEGEIGYQITTASWNFFVGSASNVYYGNGFININVMPGETWYMMVEWYSKRGGGCTGSCNVTITPSLLN